MSEPTTVAALIRKLIANKRKEVNTPADADKLTKDIAEDEEAVQLALSTYGPISVDGKVYWTYLPPRVGRIGSSEVGDGEQLHWPPMLCKQKELPKAEPLPEKVAGFIPPRESDK